MIHTNIMRWPHDRTVIVGGARCGKSTLARRLRQLGVPTFCGDPLSKVKDPEQGVTYLPEGLPYAGDGGAADWIAQNWLTMSGRWVLEGHVMARALDRWIDPARIASAIPHIVVFTQHYPGAVTLKGQETQHKGVMTTWNRISQFFPSVEYRQ